MCGFCVVFQSVSSPLAGAHLRQRRARLHRVRDQALLDDPLVDHQLGVLERRVDVAAGDDPVERLIARHVGVQLRRAGLHGLLGVGHRRQRLVVDVDQLERIVGALLRLGHDNGDDVADVADGILRGAGIGRDLELGVRHEPRARRRLQPLDVGARVDGDHAWRGLGACSCRCA